MYKPDSLRAHLSQALVGLSRDPDNLLMFIDNGYISCSRTASLSFEYRYTLNIIFTDFTGEEDAILVPLLAWAKVHQVELLDHPELKKTGIQFEVDFNSAESADISLKLELTERVIVKRGEGGRLDLHHKAEPQMEPIEPPEHCQLFMGETKLADWYTPQATV